MEKVRTDMTLHLNVNKYICTLMPMSQIILSRMDVDHSSRSRRRHLSKRTGKITGGNDILKTSAGNEQKLSTPEILQVSEKAIEDVTGADEHLARDACDTSASPASTNESAHRYMSISHRLQISSGSLGVNRPCISGAPV